MSLLAREDEEERVEEGDDQPRHTPLGRRWTVGLAAAAAIPRLIYLFVFSNPENPGLGVYDDVWHHWQIAYLTKEVGLTAPDGPRLWDLKGLDYFWGVLHPILMVVVFAVTGSIDIVLLRLVSVAFGVLAVILIFHICRNLWNTQVAVAASLLAALLPTSVMNDASGMLEPMGFALCLLGIWAWTVGRGWWSGVAFGLATMARAEAWLFSLGLIVAAHLRRITVRQRPGLWLGFGGTLALYMVVLQAKTGNLIYPLWWNFFANALGQWGTPVNATQAGVRPALGVVLVVALGGLVWTLMYRPRGYMLLTFGFGYWVFTAGMLGFTTFLSTWQPWMPISRRFEFPYEFVCVLTAIVLLYLAPRRWGIPAWPAWTAIVALLLVAQLMWIPISNVFAPTENAWRSTMADSIQLATWYRQQSYQGHAIAVPPDRPDITYGLARFGGVDGKHLLSEMYSPLAYLPPGYRYQDHVPALNAQVQCWLGENDVRMVAVDTADEELQLVIEFTPESFPSIGSLRETHWNVYAVNPSALSQTECEAARSASR